MSISKAKQRSYAAWLIKSPYVPFVDPVMAKIGSRKVDTPHNGMRVDTATTILSKLVKDPRKPVALAVQAQLELAQTVVDTKGDTAPKGWPGERCLGICEARKAAAKEAAAAAARQ
jgi:hypothetical protein